MDIPPSMTCLSGTIENDYPIVASSLVLGTEVVGTIGYLDGEGAFAWVGFVNGNFSDLSVLMMKMME